MSLGKWVAKFGKVGRRLRIIIHAHCRIGSFKISSPEYYANWLASRKNLGEETPRETIGHCFKQSAIVSIVLSFVIGNLRGQQGFLPGCVGG